MIDPCTCVIEADLSRADVVLLFELCRERHVVEFGAGGSTLLLAKIAKSLVSYEPDETWIDLVRRRLKQQTHVRVERCGQSVPPGAPVVDVYFVDGPRHLRPIWVRTAIERRLAKVIVLHDSRRSEPGYSFLFQTPCVLWLDRIVPHAKDSNCTVFFLKNKPVAWENWNITEPDNRLPHLHKQRS